MTLSHDLTFIDTAPNVSTVLGYEPDWLLGQTLYQVVHPSDATTLASKHQQCKCVTMPIRHIFRVNIQ